MIVCPNCSHQNPDGAIQCEACYTPLPAMLDCPKCGAAVQSDASFCGQCGANLNVAVVQSNSDQPSVMATTAGSDNEDLFEFPSFPNSVPTSESTGTAAMPDMSNMPDMPDMSVPDLAALDPLIEPEPLVPDVPDPKGSASSELPTSVSQAQVEELVSQRSVEPMKSERPALELEEPESSSLAEADGPSTASGLPSSSPLPTFKTTQIQTQSVQLLHTHTNTLIDIPSNLAVVHIGKPNDRVPPDIDISGFKDSEVVSRVHADIRVEGDSYYLEDVGSSNGTYVNNIPLLPGNRHKLRTGDRIALGKGDKVSFIIQMT